MNLWSPTNLNQMVGNSNSLELLRAILANKPKAPQAYLFVGPHGCGKNTLAKLFAKELIGDVTVVNPEQFSSILNQEDLNEYTCIVWDHSERMTREQAEQLATLMDRPATKTVMIFLALIASEIEPSIRARALKVYCGKLSIPELSGLLSNVCAENKTLFDVEALSQIAHDAQGIPGDALVLLSAISACGSVTMEAVTKTASGLESDIEQLLFAIANNKDPWQLAIKMKDTYVLEDMVDLLFETYSKAFLEKTDLISGKLSNYKNVGTILLKWKSAQILPVSALFILVQELVDCNEVVTQIDQKVKSVVRDREMTGSELDELILAGDIHGDSDIR